MAFIADSSALNSSKGFFGPRNEIFPSSLSYSTSGSPRAVPQSFGSTSSQPHGIGTSLPHKEFHGICSTCNVTTCHLEPWLWRRCIRSCCDSWLASNSMSLWTPANPHLSSAGFEDRTTQRDRCFHRYDAPGRLISEVVLEIANQTSGLNWIPKV